MRKLTWEKYFAQTRLKKCEKLKTTPVDYQDSIKEFEIVKDFMLRKNCWRLKQQHWINSICKYWHSTLSWATETYLVTGWISHRKARSWLETVETFQHHRVDLRFLLLFFFTSSSLTSQEDWRTKLTFVFQLLVGLWDFRETRNLIWTYIEGCLTFENKILPVSLNSQSFRFCFLWVRLTSLKGSNFTTKSSS